MLHFPSQSQSLIRLNLCASQRCQNSIERRWMNTKWHKMILYIYIYIHVLDVYGYIFIYLYFYILYLWLHRLTYIICKSQRRHSMWPVAHVAGLVSETQWSKCAEAMGSILECFMIQNLKSQKYRVFGGNRLAFETCESVGTYWEANHWSLCHCH